MDKNEVSGLDFILVKRNAKLLTLGLQIKIFSERLYGPKDFYECSSNLSNILPVIKTVKSAYFSLSQNDVSADLMLGVTTRLIFNDEEYEEFDGFFTYKVTFKLDKGIRSFKVISLNKGDTMREKDSKNSLSENLVPDVEYSVFDDIAEDFLNEFYPESLSSPIPINPTELLNRMNLKLKQGILENSVKGLISFKDGYVDVIDEDDCIEVAPGTIVVNSKITGLNQTGIYNNTVVHECIHWWFHKKYMELKMLLDNNADSIVCPSEKNIDSISDGVLKTIEIQARALAPLVLMPKEASIMKFESLIFKYSAFGDFKRGTYEQALEEFASYFGVTMLSARNRLEKLGYNESLRKDINIKVKVRNTTKFLNYWDFCKLENDPRLSFLLDKGLVIYADGFIVPNLPDYIEYDRNEQPRLTKLAIANIANLAMPVKVEWKSSDLDSSMYLMHSLCSSGTVSRDVKMDLDSINTILKFYKNLDPKRPQAKKFFKYFRLDDTEKAKFKYSEYLNIMMENHNISIRKLAEKSKVGKTTIDNYRSYTEHAYSESVTLRLCIGMNAYPYETLNLLSLRGTDLENGKTSRSKYLLELVVDHYDEDIDYWLNYLKDKDPDAL